MSPEAARLAAWLKENEVDAELLRFDRSVHSVAEAVEVTGYPVERFTKSIVMITASGRVVVAMVPADARAGSERVRKVLGETERPRIATPEEISRHLGQRVGGNSPLNAGHALVLIDPRVLTQDWIITGGGDDRSLVKIAVTELKRVVRYTEARVRK